MLATGVKAILRFYVNMLESGAIADDVRVEIAEAACRTLMLIASDIWSGDDYREGDGLSDRVCSILCRHDIDDDEIELLRSLNLSDDDAHLIAESIALVFRHAGFYSLPECPVEVSDDP